MFLAISRTFREALSNFWRNGWLSFATIVILTMSLYIFGVLFLTGTYAENLITSVQKKVNVSIYFKSDTEEKNILDAKSDLEKYNEISTVEYVTKEQALENFKKNNANEPVIMKSLEEIGDNPLLASLVVKAQSPDKYEAVINYIKDAQFKDDISRVNYEKNKDVIDGINVVMREVRKFGSVLITILALIAVLITFNTIRLTIYAHRQEIEVMRLVGASNMFIRLPFIFEGIIYGLIASVLSLAALLITTKLVMMNISPRISESITGLYWQNIALLFLAELAFGVVLGVLSSMISIRKYLKV